LGLLKVYSQQSSTAHVRGVVWHGPASGVVWGECRRGDK